MRKALTKDEFRQYAELSAQAMLGITLDEALRKLEAGELRDTLAEAELTMYRRHLK